MLNAVDHLLGVSVSRFTCHYHLYNILQGSNMPSSTYIVNISHRLLKSDPKKLIISLAEFHA